MMTRLRSLARTTANMPLLTSLACFFLACLFLTPSAHAGAWNLSGALFTHDPSITQEGGAWWIFETGSNGIGVKCSGDGHAWSQGGSISGNGLSWWKPYNGNSASIWAGGGRFIAPGRQSIYGSGIARHELDSSNNSASILFINNLYWSSGWPTY